MALAADRVDCLREWDTLEIGMTDVLDFFNGDEVAQWMEGGFQIGGNCKCTSCGIHINSIDDSAHCVQRKFRSFFNIQPHVTAGLYGSRKLALNPLGNLSLQEVRQELAARHLDSSREAKVILQRLIHHLS